MSEGGMKFKFAWLEKIKKIKHIEIYVLILFVAIVGLIFYSNKTTHNDASEETSSVTGYISNIESKLENILSRIDGVSNVSVMISLDMHDSVVENSSLKINSFPSIKGVLITAKGVDNTYAKMKVLHAVETVIDVSSNNIQIFSSN